jgi:hypothetical protein
MLSLLSCLLEDWFPKAVPYIYQIAALVGYGHLIISKEFFAIFDEYARFWYSFIYLLVALTNIVAVNIYFAIARGQWNLAKIWSAAVTFPTILIAMYFVSDYASAQEATLPLLTMQIGLVVSAAIMGLSILLLLSPETVRNAFKRAGR